MSKKTFGFLWRTGARRSYRLRRLGDGGRAQSQSDDGGRKPVGGDGEAESCMQVDPMHDAPFKVKLQRASWNLRRQRPLVLALLSLAPELVI
jgi:hypothetical protein